MAVGGAAPGLDQAVGEQGVQVPADGRGGQAEPRGQAGGGYRAVLQDEPGDPPPGARIRAQAARRACRAGRGSPKRREPAQASPRHARGALVSCYQSHVFHNIIVP